MKGRPPITRTPQDKKALSLAKDRRNAYGESDKASRKAIPARKAGENRKSRRKAVHALKVVERVDERAAEVIVSSLAHDVERVGGWTKSPDMPLGEVVAHAKRAALSREGRKGRVRAEAERQRAAPDYSGTIMIASTIHDGDRD
ncbi:hypothetical protein [Sphingomonas sp. LM7]|uniref:hypothetical protein n=1 Tax=Sphingomonas sp. LM7 TaxID=1938607 RepID=UPI000983B51A|nr:hypothetical protein [Sphingomonas sp. LM7]AQR74985.1 hypothetical protein BXU08_16145 [Sphingomonas sp. LM7]